jgi:16S rRNA (guanine966-N2)-methyltransferase
MRIIAGAWRGRALQAPPGLGTRPTADRVRQSLFDMILHAPWGGRALIADAVVLDAFAGTGALGLEALSRGAARALFFEQDRGALAALRANIAACGAGDQAVLHARDVLQAGAATGPPAALAFFDPPYGQGLVQRAVNHLSAGGWLAPDCLFIAETGRLESVVETSKLLAQRVHGVAQLVVWRA